MAKMFDINFDIRMPKEVKMFDVCHSNNEHQYDLNIKLFDFRHLNDKRQKV